MFDFVLYYLLLEQTYWVATILLILLFSFLERFIPRFEFGAFNLKVSTILIIASSAYFLIWLFKQTVYKDTIQLLLNLQVYSLSKSSLPLMAMMVVSFLIVDLLLYLFHYISHELSLLWRLHSIHHIDEQVSAKTAVLHHPLESLASMLFLLVFSVIFGLPIVVLIIYAAIATIHNIFVHSNIALNTTMDRLLRSVIITPDMHRTHHSLNLKEGNSNFGQLFSFWDRLFGTYTARPETSEEHIKMGLPKNENPSRLNPIGLLLFPFQKRK